MATRKELFLKVFGDSEPVGLTFDMAAKRMTKANPGDPISKNVVSHMHRQLGVLTHVGRHRYRLASGACPSTPTPKALTDIVRAKVYELVKAASPSPGVTTVAVDAALGNPPKRKTNYTFTRLRKDGLIKPIGKDAAGLGLWITTDVGTSVPSVHATPAPVTPATSPETVAVPPSTPTTVGERIHISVGGAVVDLPSSVSSRYLVEIVRRLQQS